MKILITGKPGSGKSTLLTKVIKNYDQSAIGIRTLEVLENGERKGFDVINHLNKRTRFMDVDLKSDKNKKVGKYFVKIENLEGILEETFLDTISDSIKTIYIDEIGRAQMLSEKFTRLTDSLFESDLNLIATIVYDAEEWSLKYKENPNVFLIEINQLNREVLQDIIENMLKVSEQCDSLAFDKIKYLKERLKFYLNKKMFIQARKLFYNSVNYVANDKVRKLSVNSYIVKGKHGDHEVSLVKNSYICDCNLFNGRNNYAGYKGICSHIESVNLFNI